MEPKFQTSFIPKKQMQSPVVGMQSIQRAQRAGVSIFMAIAVVVFIAALGSVGGAYAWKQYLLNKQTEYKQDLADRQTQFDLTTIQHLKKVNMQIDTARQLLNNHLDLTQIFGIIGQMTIEKVRFTSMDLTVPPNLNDGIKLSLSGYGLSASSNDTTGMQTIAFQSDVLGSLSKYNLTNTKFNLSQIVKNPILSNPSPGENGKVSFGFSATVSAKTLSYEASVGGGSASGTDQTNLNLVPGSDLVDPTLSQ